MAFDFGTKQIGVACGQTLLYTAAPLTTLRAVDGKPDPQALEAVITQWSPALLVVGKPLNMDDSESELTLRARKFARRLAANTGIPTVMVDERLSTREAYGRAGTNAKPGSVDAIAAGVILESWYSEAGI